MLAKLHHNTMESVALERQVKDGESLDCFDTLYPVDQNPAGNDAEEDALLMLWGDVSILARHPMRINF